MSMRGLFGTMTAGLEAKATDISALTWERLLGSGPSKAGVSVNVDTALKVSTVLACCRVLANGIAQVPLKVYREDDKGAKLPAKDHPTFKLLWRRPNEWQTSFEMRQMMMFHAVLNWNAYAYLGWVGRGKNRRLTEIIPLVPPVTVHQADDYSLTYEIRDKKGATIDVLPRSSIMHLRGPTWNGVTGMDALQTAREAIGLAIATEESHARLHANGSRPGGLISVEGTLEKATRDRLREQLAENVEGLRNAFRTMILDQKAEYTPFAMTGVDSQHLETRKFQIEEICRDLGVFPQMVGHSDKTSTFASAESFFLAHVMHALGPWIENWQQVFSRDLFPDEDDISAEFSVQGLLRGDHKTRAEFYAAGIVNGYFTRNEVRRWETLNPIDGLDEPLVPLNMGTQAERDEAAGAVAEEVKAMLGHNGGSALDDVEIKKRVARALSAPAAARLAA